jgi:hypothetical protein
VGERDIVVAAHLPQVGGKKKGSACQEKRASEHVTANPFPKTRSKARPKPKPSSADVAERGVASIGMRSSGNLCVDAYA